MDATNYKPLKLDTYEVKVPPDLVHILPNYLNRRKSDLVQLVAALCSEDFKSIKTIGHKLKGNATSYGLESLSHIGDKIELEAEKNNIEALKPLINNFEILVVELDRFINENFKK